MKSPQSCPKLLIVPIIILSIMLLASCSADTGFKTDASVALVKNAAMSTYGTGFAVGIPGEEVTTLITAYSVIATPNGAPPKTAEVRINELEKNLTAHVEFYDPARNFAILKLSEPSGILRPMLLKSTTVPNETVYVRGYDGTGNIMSDFEKFNISDIVQYHGNISTYDETNNLSVFRFSNEFNRAAVGAPAVDRNGNVVGMCAYSLSIMNTYSQYILSSSEISAVLTSQHIPFMTSNELTYKRIIITALASGILVLAAIIIFTLLCVRKKPRASGSYGKPEFGSTAPCRAYLHITGGSLAGTSLELRGNVVIGRDPAQCNIVYPVNEPGVSALHCMLQYNGNTLSLTDCFSRYGTFLENGTRISSTVPHEIRGNSFAFYIADPKNRIEIIFEKENTQ